MSHQLLTANDLASQCARHRKGAEVLDLFGLFIALSSEMQKAKEAGLLSEGAGLDATKYWAFYMQAARERAAVWDRMVRMAEP